MANYGFNFRSTAVFVTDPAGTTYSIGDLFPQTRNGITFGWTSGPSVRDRSTGVNARVAGIDFIAAPNTRTFQVTLPATGDYNIGCAMGDATFAEGVQYIEIFDNTTSLYSMTSASTPGANQYYDINGVKRTSDTDWFANQTFKLLTFATTTLKVVIGKSGVGVSACIAHLDVNQAGSTPLFLLLGVGT